MTRSLTTLSAPIPEASNPADTDTWGATTETFHEALDRAVGGDHDISTTGGSTTLSEAQNDVIQLYVTGTLISNATIYVRARPKLWIVRNATSGAFTLTVRVIGDVGTAVVVNQTRSAIVHTDGTNCYLLDLGTLSGTPASVSGPVEYPDGAEGTPSITNTGDTNTGLFFPAEGSVGVSTQGGERLRVDPSGYVVVGYKGAGLGFGDTTTPKLQVHGTDAATAIAVARYSNDTNPAHVRLAKSRNGTAGSHTIVQNGDTVGVLSFDASDGGEFAPLASISGIVNGTPGNDDLPGALVFSTTPDGTKVPTEAMRIDPNAFLSLDGDTDTGFQNGGTNILNVYTANTLRLSFDASGRVLVGSSGTALTLPNTFAPLLQIAGNGATTGIGIGQYSADAVGPVISLFKSRNATVNGSTVVTANDVLGEINFGGSDGANRLLAARIVAESGGAPGTADMPGRLRFMVTADAGTTPADALVIDNAGRLLINGDRQVANAYIAASLTSPRIQVIGATVATAMMQIKSTGASSTVAPHLLFTRSVGAGAVADDNTIGVILFNAYDGLADSDAAAIKAEVDGTPGSADMPTRLTFWTTPDASATPVERLRITQAGVHVIGGVDPITVNSIVPRLQVLGTDSATSAMQLGRWSADSVGSVIYGHKSRNATIGGATVVSAGDDILLLSAWANDGTNPVEAARITMEVASGVTPGSNDMPGRITLATTSDGSNTPTTRVTVDHDGDVTMTATLTVENSITINDGQANFTRSAAAPGAFNRTTSDGDVIIILQGGATEGAISVAGTTVTYGSFSGSHWSQLADGSPPNLLRGTVVDSIAQLAAWSGETNVHLPCFKVSDTPGSKAVYGVFLSLDDDGDAIIVSLGTNLVRVAAGQTPAIGDYLESNGDGCARVQADDVLRSSTLAKVISTVVAETFPDGSFLLPCTLHCG